MEEWNVDLMIHVVQYLNIIDMAKMCGQSRRCYYIIHQYRLYRGLHLVSATSFRKHRRKEGTHFPSTEVFSRAISDLQGPPQLTLAFCTGEAMHHDPSLYHMITRRSPSNALTLGCVAETIQTSGIHWRYKEQLPLFESSSQLALTMLSGFSSKTKMISFSLPYKTKLEEFSLPGIDSPFAAFVKDHFDHNFDWKLVILYIVGGFQWVAEGFIQEMQAKFPDVTIAGGTCSDAFVSMPIDKKSQFPSVENMVRRYDMQKLQQIYAELGGGSIPDSVVTHAQLATLVYNEVQRRKYTIKGIHFGVCGIALAGDVPIRTVVSRGLESITAKELRGDGTPLPTSTFSIHDSDVVSRRIESRGVGKPTYRVEVRSVRDDTTEEVISAMGVLRRFGLYSCFGVQFPNKTGFSIEPSNKFYKTTRSEEESRSIGRAKVDFFNFSGDQAMTDLEFCMNELRQRTLGMEVLGAVMIASNARGPNTSPFFPEVMMDAKSWARHFPTTPCTGFFAIDEIGPNPRAGRQSIFQQDDACILSFTAVVLLFLSASSDEDKKRSMDDSSIDAFVRRQLGNLNLS